MSKIIRIIPRLDIKGPNLVKGIHLEGLRVLGKPEDFALKYYQDGADELIYMDVVATLYGRNNLTDIVKKTAENIFIPLTVGGGIRTIEDIKNILRTGADKVAINTAAIKNPKLITEGAKIFGSQCIVVSIEAKKRGNNAYEAYTDNGRERTGLDVFSWAKQAAEFGAGEILVTSIDNEGTGKGYDISLILKICDSVNVPVIVCGGASQAEHFVDAILKGKADAVCASSCFHYWYLEDISNINKFQNEAEGNLEYLKSFITNNKIRKTNTFSIKYLKNYLAGKGVSCRI